ncbi:MAG: hypothetical protein ACOYI8_10850 [Christensenellales bacterium]|jgi:hypothetical protein
MKKVLSIFVAMFLLISMLPVGVLAEEYKGFYSMFEISDFFLKEISADGTETVTDLAGLGVHCESAMKYEEDVFVIYRLILRAMGEDVISVDVTAKGEKVSILIEGLSKVLTMQSKEIGEYLTMYNEQLKGAEADPIELLRYYGLEFVDEGPAQVSILDTEYSAEKYVCEMTEADRNAFMEKLFGNKILVLPVGTQSEDILYRLTLYIASESTVKFVAELMTEGVAKEVAVIDAVETSDLDFEALLRVADPETADTAEFRLLSKESSAYPGHPEGYLHTYVNGERTGNFNVGFAPVEDEGGVKTVISASGYDDGGSEPFDFGLQIKVGEEYLSADFSNSGGEMLVVRYEDGAARILVRESDGRTDYIRFRFEYLISEDTSLLPTPDFSEMEEIDVMNPTEEEWASIEGELLSVAFKVMSKLANIPGLSKELRDIIPNTNMSF